VTLAGLETTAAVILHKIKDLMEREIEFQWRCYMARRESPDLAIANKAAAEKAEGVIALLRTANITLRETNAELLSQSRKN